MHLLSQIIYSCKTLYMFRTVFPSIIRSSKLRILQRYMSNRCCYSLLSGIRWNWVLEKRSTCFGRSFRPSSGAQNCLYRNGICQTAAATRCYRGWDVTEFLENALHVSDGLSVHHQELKTAYTATVYVKQLLLPAAAGSSSCLTYTVAVYAVLSSWWWTERPSETCRAFSKNSVP
jgi:hypothetical protein